MNARCLHLILLASASVCFAAPPEPAFRAQQIDRISIGYGVAVADVDGDKRPDVVLADKKQFVWYRNPGPGVDAKWEKFLLAENLTKNDNVCVAAQDIDGDGKCEIAVGAEWNPGDTVNSGAVFYLIAPEDRTKPWEAVKFPSVEPTTHRMRWVQTNKEDWGLVVLPLHGRGNKNAEGASVKVLLYRRPADVRGEWKSEVINESMHATHNFDPIAGPHEKYENHFHLLLGGREGVRLVNLERPSAKFKDVFPEKTKVENYAGVGEIRMATGQGWMAAIEPMHGNRLVVYRGEKAGPERLVLTEKLIQGHALACGDLLGTKRDQIVVGWRGNGPGDKVGISLWTAMDDAGKEWRESVVDDNKMACEDLQLADLDGDGDLDIVASGRATRNVVIYWNETKK